MTRRYWFCPQTPDVLGLLRAQVAVTIQGLDAFAAWAGGDTAAAAMVRDAEHRGDVAKRALLGALRAAFVTPLEPEDVFALSRNVDWILDYARDLVFSTTSQPTTMRRPFRCSKHARAFARLGSPRRRLGRDLSWRVSRLQVGALGLEVERRAVSVPLDGGPSTTNSLIAIRARAMHRGQCSTVNQSTRCLMLSPQRGQFKNTAPRPPDAGSSASTQTPSGNGRQLKTIATANASRLEHERAPSQKLISTGRPGSNRPGTHQSAMLSWCHPVGRNRCFAPSYCRRRAASIRSSRPVGLRLSLRRAVPVFQLNPER
jgi:hypothetical protein